jgi:hypothetical protein
MMEVEDNLSLDKRLIIPKCVDITFANPEDVAEVNSSNCFNSTDISFNNVYSIATGSSSSATRTLASASLLPLALFAMYAML